MIDDRVLSRISTSNFHRVLPVGTSVNLNSEAENQQTFFCTSMHPYPLLPRFLVL
jgi:hypothetical protein